MGVKMEFYKAIKKIVGKTGKVAAIGIVATLPYVCESCSVVGAIPYNCGSETRQELTERSQTSEKEVLETILKG